MTLALFIAITLASEILGTLSGFGSSTYFVPLTNLLLPFHLVLALTAMLHIVSNISKLIAFREHAIWRPWLGYIVTSAVMTAVGAVLSDLVASPALRMILGAFLMVLPPAQIFIRRRTLPTRVTGGLTALSGFFTGLIGTGGALRAAALSSLHLEKNEFVFVSSLIDLLGDVLRGSIYLREGYMDWSQWPLVVALLMAAPGGTLLGKSLLQRVSQRHFETIIWLLVFASGVVLLTS